MRNYFSPEERRVFADAQLFGLWDDKYESQWTPYDPLIHSLRSPERAWVNLGGDFGTSVKVAAGAA